MSSNISNEVYEDLCSQGAIVSTEWLSQCLSYLLSSCIITRATKRQAVVDAVLQTMLDSDLHVAMDEVDLLPENIQELHLVRLFAHQPRILQIDEVTDVGSAGQRQQLQLSGGALGAGDIVNPAGEEKDEVEIAADRRAAAAGFQGPRHMLKVYLTDGVNRAVALDTQGALAASYQQCCANVRGGTVPSLHAFYAGAKLSVRNILVRRGALMLTKDTIAFLGGTVHRLQALDTSSSSSSSGGGGGHVGSNTSHMNNNNEVRTGNGMLPSVQTVQAGVQGIQAVQGVQGMQQRVEPARVNPSLPVTVAAVPSALSSVMPPPTNTYRTGSAEVSTSTRPAAPPLASALLARENVIQSNNLLQMQQHHHQQQQQQQHQQSFTMANLSACAAPALLGAQDGPSVLSNAHNHTTIPIPSQQKQAFFTEVITANISSFNAAPSSSILPSAQRAAMCDDEHTLDGNSEEEEEEWDGEMEDDVALEGKEGRGEKSTVREQKNGKSEELDEQVDLFHDDVTDGVRVAADEMEVDNQSETDPMKISKDVGKYPAGELFGSDHADIYSSHIQGSHLLGGASTSLSLSFDAFYDDVPFTSDAPLLTCDLTLSPSPNPFPSPVPTPPSSPREEEEKEEEIGGKEMNEADEGQGWQDHKEQEMKITSTVQSSHQQMPLHDSDQGRHYMPQSRNISPQYALHHALSPESASASKSTHPPVEAVHLSYLDEPAQGSDEFLVRCIASRVTRLKTVELSAPEDPSKRANNRVFQVHLELDDGHRTVLCEVSDSLVERFLDMSAADHQALMSQLPSKQDKRQAQIGLMHRFVHFHGLFWACWRPFGSQTAATEEAPNMVLIDFALDQVQNVCASLLARLQ